MAPQVTSFNLGTDTNFAFGSAKLRPAGHTTLDTFATKMVAHQQDIQAIHIIGYTDRLGSTAFNEDLSRRRATAVAEYLVAHGVPVGLMTTSGRGESEPVKTCNGSMSPQLISCLAPNRRVFVDVDTRLPDKQE